MAEVVALGKLLTKRTTTRMLQMQESFWQRKDATVNGMLDGFEALDPADVKSSVEFINRVFPGDRKAHTVLDVGAGIGRVTKRVLIPMGFGHVDLMDFSQRYLDTSRSFVNNPAMRDTFCCPMNEFDWCKGQRQWSMIWVQWVAIYLPDEDFVDFFRKAAECLRTDTEHACIVLKENVIIGDQAPIVDSQDASVTRSDVQYKRMWAAAGLEVFTEEKVSGFPEDVFPVYMYGLKPIKGGAPSPSATTAAVVAEGGDDTEAAQGNNVLKKART